MFFFGVVKELRSGLYVQKLREKVFLTIAFEPLFICENKGQPHNMTSSNINIESTLPLSVIHLSFHPLVLIYNLLY